MSKLLKLKEWVTVSAAARHLSIMAGEEVSEGDILRLTLDGHMKLSVNLVNGAPARAMRAVEPSEIEWETVPSLDGKREVQMPKDGPVRSFDDGRVFQLSSEVHNLAPGVWDLPLIGPERHDVEREFQRLTGGPEYTMCTLDGVLVAATDGSVFELLAHFEDNPYFDKEKLKKPRGHPGNFYPAASLPEDAVLVVRTSALHALYAKLAAEQVGKPAASALSTRERDTLLKLVIGMAIEGYRYSPEAARNEATGQIAGDLEKLGIAVGDDTVRKWLNVAATTVLPRRTQSR